MLKSMTGFGRGEHSDGGRNITCEIKAVNHRYLDITVKMPRKYAFAEERIKSSVKEKISRGKLEVSLFLENLTEDDVSIRLNTGLAKQYYENLKELKAALKLTDRISLDLMANLPDIMRPVTDIEDEDYLLEQVLIPVNQALKSIEEMRGIEGEKLARDILMRADLLEKLLKKIELKAPQIKEIYFGKIKDRMEELLKNVGEFQEERIIMEAALYADKTNVDEEIVRLYSHISQLRDIISLSQGADGKKLDFLIQEMNREANTIGSKANNLEITNNVLAIKSEIEKIREQVQNIE